MYGASDGQFIPFSMWFLPSRTLIKFSMDFPYTATGGIGVVGMGATMVAYAKALAEKVRSFSFRSSSDLVFGSGTVAADEQVAIWRCRRRLHAVSLDVPIFSKKRTLSDHAFPFQFLHGEKQALPAHFSIPVAKLYKALPRALLGCSVETISCFILQIRLLSMLKIKTATARQKTRWCRITVIIFIRYIVRRRVAGSQLSRNSRNFVRLHHFRHFRRSFFYCLGFAPVTKRITCILAHYVTFS